jgi:hypothetical protein
MDFCQIISLIFVNEFISTTLDQFYWCWKSQYPEKTTDLTQVTDKLYYMKLYKNKSLPQAGIKLKS